MFDAVSAAQPVLERIRAERAAAGLPLFNGVAAPAPPPAPDAVEKAAKPPTPAPIIIDWRELGVTEIFAELEPVEYLIEALDICVGAPALCAGYGYSGKSLALQEICLAIACGDAAFGLFPCKQGRAVYVDREQGPRLTRERFQRLARARGVDPASLSGRLSVVSMPGLGLDMPGAEAFLRQQFAGVIFGVFDSLKAFTPTLDENDSKIRAPLDTLTRVSLGTGCAFGVVHHARKPTEGQRGGARMAIRGSGAIYDGCSSVLVFEGEPGEATRVTHQKARNSGKPCDPFALTVQDVAAGTPGDITYTERWGLRIVGEMLNPNQVDGKRRRAEEIVATYEAQVLDWLTGKDPTTATKIAAGIGGRREYVELALDALCEARKVDRQRRGSAKVYRLAEPWRAPDAWAPPVIPGAAPAAAREPMTEQQSAELSEALSTYPGAII